MITQVDQQMIQGVKFTVDDVKATENRLELDCAAAILERRLGTKLLVFSHSRQFELVKNWYYSNHAVAAAVSLAFNGHRPLLLDPDRIWITIAQGFAEHINQNAERFRSQFVKHEGKQELNVEINIPLRSEDWPSIVQQWALGIRDHVGPEIYQTLECNFTTTTPITQTVSYIVMMDTFRKYFDYSAYGICGIPEITFLGTVEDWQSIRDRVQSLAKYDLAWWTDRLLPICEEFINTASGQPSLDFWCNIYKPQHIYGTHLINGWLADLFPYVEESGIISSPLLVKNPILAIPRSQLTSNDGIASNVLPLGLSRVPCTFYDIRSSKRIKLEIVGGFIGVRQDQQSGMLQAESGWALILA